MIIRNKEVTLSSITENRKVKSDFLSEIVKNISYRRS